ncbi:MAG: AAA family ATPase [Vicinamibacterales bacterium]
MSVADELKNMPSADAKAAAEAMNRERRKQKVREQRAFKRELDAEDRTPDHVQTLVGYALPALLGHAFPKRRALLTRGGAAILREAQLGQIYAIRGVGKTWLAQTLALVAATGVEALGFGTPSPCQVLYVDGEMDALEIQERFDKLRIHLSKHADLTARGPLFDQLTSANLVVVAADWQADYLPRLDTPEGQAALEPFIANADLIVLDNRSCLFDPEGEKDPTAWQPAQDWLLSLRRRGKTVLIIHHSNRQGGARGHSKPEDPMNLLLKLTWPDDYSADQGARFLVEFDKARGVYGAAVAPFIATLTDVDGWRVETVDRDEPDTAGVKLRDYLRLAEAAGERPKSGNAAIAAAKVGRNKGLEAWAAMLKSGELVKHADGGFHIVDTVGGGL